MIGKNPVPDDEYYDHIRLDVEGYYELLKLVESKLKKQKWVKTPIPPHLRLQICLRYLASGDSMLMISYEFATSCNTVSKIVTETCEVIWEVLKDAVLPLPNSDLWKEKAHEFKKQLNFPHCMGAIFGKQLLFQTPFYSETRGKDKGNLAFFGIIDANCCFSLSSITQESMTENSIVFSQSEVGRDLQDNVYDFPLELSEEYSDLPYVLVGNRDFPLTNNILRSYESVDTLDLAKDVYNEKIDHVSKYASNAFDILTSQWKIFHKKFCTNASNTTKIIRAVVCLHNFVMKRDIAKPMNERQYAVIIERDASDYLQGCIDIFMKAEDPSDEALKGREKFKKLFCKVTSITIQDWNST
ncbi:uncharacterized protein LOC106641357 [Copidosoma floridanum]|uniref:uncharacterized protein LOC106641357 n=1 Tax=Copidosoma floridanum TaxID=29053 RepID=UPI0006C95B4E|nr:uncharacterized protein LOC106641357 [Copidosoma floridanum]